MQQFKANQLESFLKIKSLLYVKIADHKVIEWHFLILKDRPSLLLLLCNVRPRDQVF